MVASPFFASGEWRLNNDRRRGRAAETPSTNSEEATSRFNTAEGIPFRNLRILGEVHHVEEPMAAAKRPRVDANRTSPAVETTGLRSPLRNEEDGYSASAVKKAVGNSRKGVESRLGR
jgi:hypothetical protein